MISPRQVGPLKVRPMVGEGNPFDVYERCYAQRREALEILGALAMVDGRWEEAVSTLDALAADATFEPQRRAEFLLAAGDVMARRYGDREVAEPFYERAQALWPGNPRFGRPPEGVR